MKRLGTGEVRSLPGAAEPGEAVERARAYIRLRARGFAIADRREGACVPRVNPAVQPAGRKLARFALQSEARGIVSRFFASSSGQPSLSSPG